MIVNTGYVSFYVQDMDRMLHYYSVILGMKQKFSLTGEDNVRRVYLELAERQSIELVKTGHELTAAPVCKDYFGYQKVCFEVENAADAYAELVEKGVTPDTEVRMTVDYAFAFNLTDPEGNHLEIVEYPPTALQLQADRKGD
jgi:catechol 2,3-dioxygenase-like lactoylglutathione lyase family enzyme